MNLTAPDWLQQRNGDLRLGYDGRSVFVCFRGEPQYELTPIPVAGKHGCRIIQTINGKPVDCTATFATGDEAVRGGLEDLRTFLGW